MEPVGDYEYSKRDLIGHGAFAVVFKGRLRKKPEFVVAIKCITKKNLAKSQNLLSKEIKILKELSDLHHENVVQLLDCKETSHHVYLVMEYCNGGDLADYLQAKGTLSEDTIAGFLRQIAGAMCALVGKGIVHRDMKPQNILLCHNGKNPNPPPSEMRLKIADFGFARFLQDGVMAATLCGSPMYMAPEVIMSLQYDAKADLWSIGTICYQCLTGKAPFQAQTPQQLKQFYEKNAGLAPNIPNGTSPELRNLLMGMLKRNARDRLDFEEFFNHPFLQSKATPKVSSPVPVPRSRSRGSIGESPPVKPVSASPLSGHVPASPPNPSEQASRGDPEPMDAASSPHEVGGFLKVHRGNAPQPPPRSRSPTEDFVMVPDNIPSDHSASSTSSPRPPSSVDLNAIFSDNSPDSPKPAPRTVRVSPHNVAGIDKKGAESPTSPWRPSTLPVSSPMSSPVASQPIPVPSQVKAFEQMQRSSPGSPKAASPSASPQLPSQHRPGSSGQPVPIPRKSSAGSLPSVGSLSPPTIQFTIGTPPMRPARKNSQGTPPLGRHIVTPPSNSGSPLRRTGITPPRNLTPTFAGPSSLPTIMGSPTKAPAHFPDFPDVVPIRTSPAKVPLDTPFATARTHTVPTNMAQLGFNLNENCSLIPMNKLERCATEPEQLFQRSSSCGGKLSEQMLRAAFGTTPSNLGLSPCLTQQSPTSNLLIPYSSSNPVLHRESSGSSLKDRFFIGGDMANPSEQTNTGSRRPSVFNTESPTNANTVPYASSPPNMEGPISFVAPELHEEVLMDKEHIETVGKLSFVLALVECIIELAQSRSSPITESVDQKPGDTFRLDHIPFATENQRHLEQLVLYVRGLQLLSSSIELARCETKAGRLQASNTVKSILKEMNNYYHRCLGLCRHLHNKGVGRNNPQVNPASAAVTADKLIYSYAIEMCQTAALDELFGNPQECFRRYRNAQILLHSLAQQAHHVKDRELLNKYKEAVEKRLFNLHSQGYVQAMDS